ncbi:hypothetical protein L3X38_024805 [Prunus dulcis]|uniref:Transposable element protein n=1 Tax=Prunus dulcis TaxID=3755 RepID=A0AAD4Z5S6_PRUDU|nr:hypothetical protein L3X38_024805 [Prunus dulcis]
MQLHEHNNHECEIPTSPYDTFRLRNPLHLMNQKGYYLKGTTDYGLFYKKGLKGDFLLGYSDSDYAGDFDDRKSTSGYVFMYGSVAVAWSSKKQLVVTLSTTEAEFIAVASCACQAIWLRRLLNELHCSQYESTLIYCDNSLAIKLSKIQVMHGRSKHIDVSLSARAH